MNPSQKPFNTLVGWLFVCACNGGGSASIDAAVDAEVDAPPPSGPCWPEGIRAPQGTITLGTGRTAFQPMPDELPLIYGPQGGFHIEVYSQMTGFPLGSTTNILDPGNPRTMFRAYFVDTGQEISRGVCPLRVGYIPNATGQNDLQTGAATLYEVCYGTTTIFNRPVRVVVEIMDAKGDFYATAEKIITPLPPIDWRPEDDYPDAPPCPP